MASLHMDALYVWIITCFWRTAARRNGTRSAAGSEPTSARWLTCPVWMFSTTFLPSKVTSTGTAQQQAGVIYIHLTRKPVTSEMMQSLNLRQPTSQHLSRKFHCTRNYIHINLFSSFILRASAVFIKDAVLFSDESLDHCFMSTVTCKSAVAFFQFSILANYFWLLVEGMYLQTLLVLTFVLQRKYFWWYILTGWGVPSVVLVVWVLTRNFYDNSGCWDDTENIGVWWIIKGPITASLFANIIIFLNVIRILVEKLKSAGVGGNDTGHFMRLAKSTLFLIPLFGMHYTVFAFLPENTGETARLYIELGLGSFQGFVVALLYCFLNGEVQAELKRCLWRWHSQNQLSPGKKRRITVTQISVLELAEPPHISSIKVTSL
ncbi:growth hormone releasing hormone receptor a isoform X2 [Silurus meridionalis]|uniref:growth hormone releasing hormone receptor a isoform X2 n=1 Tax=Silurus meridionalis TaxID=175797 RepID=UPI001EEA7D08|nr:growth hormone releasing hormone receptor a isoform X2 [Silurus meridionalis]